MQIETLLIIKAIHIIFMATWFAGLFGIVQIFIYHVQSENKNQSEKELLQKQYKTMEMRMWYFITWPSMILVLLSGCWLLLAIPGDLLMPFMHLKLSFVFVLVLYHFYCQRIYNQLRKDNITISSFTLWLFNGIALLLLFAIVFIITLKNSFGFLWGLGGLLVFGLLIFVAAKFFKNSRK